jgi:hypothetical protein
VRLFGCVVTLSVMSGQTVRDQHGPSILDRGVVVGNLNREQAKYMAQDFLQQEGKRNSIARLIIGLDRYSVDMNYAHGTPHNTYASTVADVERAGFPKGPIARVLAIAGQAKFSYLENGHLTEEVLSGTSGDPIVFHEGKYAYELLHFKLTAPRPGAIRGDPYFLTVYLKAPPSVSLSSFIRIYRMLSKLTRINDLDVVVRPDPWFMEDQLYPAVLAFTQPLQIPNSVQYLGAARVSCALVHGRGVLCTGRNFLP